MKKFVIAAVILVLAIIAGVYFLSMKGLGNQDQELLLDDYKCNINNVDYYVHSQVIYLTSKAGEEYVYTDFGIYQRKPAKDGWILNLHTVPKNETIYTTVFKWIDTKQHPTAGAVTCEKVTQFPEGFQTFIDNHGIIFKLIKENFKEIEKDNTIPAELQDIEQ